MIKKVSQIITIVALTLAFTKHNAFTKDKFVVDEITKSEIEKIIHDYLLENPEILLKAYDILEKRSQKRRQKQQTQVLKSSFGEIFNSPYDGVIGNPSGDVTIIEFFDYNCGYCKRALSDKLKLIQSDKKLRFVLKEFPIFGEESLKIHTISIAFLMLMPEQYPKLHARLLSKKGRVTSKQAFEIAVSLGVDKNNLQQQMKNPQIKQVFQKNNQLAENLAINGTPAYVIGDEVIPGAIGWQKLSKKIANVRKCGSTKC